MKKLATLNKWRNIVETSIMRNNEEVVFYSDEKIDYDYLKQTFLGKKINDLKIVTSRPVFDFEITEGLDICSQNPRYLYFYNKENNKRVPDITLFLDAYFIIKQQAESYQKIMKENFSPTEFLAHHVGSSYYDCMSGGFPAYELMICRMLIQNPRIDTSEYVYPGSEEHKEKTGRSDINLQDFLEETKNVEERFGNKLQVLMKQFSFPMLP